MMLMPENGAQCTHMPTVLQCTCEERGPCSWTVYSGRVDNPHVIRVSRRGGEAVSQHRGGEAVSQHRGGEAVSQQR